MLSEDWNCWLLLKSKSTISWQYKYILSYISLLLTLSERVSAETLLIHLMYFVVFCFSIWGCWMQIYKYIIKYKNVFLLSHYNYTLITSQNPWEALEEREIFFFYNLVMAVMMMMIMRVVVMMMMFNAIC